VKRVGSLLGHLIKDLEIEDGVRLAEIRKNWQSLFREPLPYHMAPSRLTGGDLLLNVDSPVWLQEMNIHREEILKKLTPFGVRAVRFRLGKISALTTSEVKIQKTKPRTLTAEERSYIDQTISQINDDRLKRTVKTAIERAIASGKTKIR
jgi:hypothetical protein